MNPSLEAVRRQFMDDITSCMDTVGIADNLAKSLPGLNLDELYRYSLAGAVSALDTCVHSVVRAASVLQLQGIGPSHALELPISSDLYRRHFQGDATAIGEIESAVRLAHGRWSMQFSADIANAIKTVCSRPLWINIADGDPSKAKSLKDSLDAVVRRRNKIVHESDLDPSLGEKWPIDSDIALQSVRVILERGTQIIQHVARDY